MILTVFEIVFQQIQGDLILAALVIHRIDGHVFVTDFAVLGLKLASGTRLKTHHAFERHQGRVKVTGHHAVPQAQNLHLAIRQQHTEDGIEILSDIGDAEALGFSQQPFHLHRPVGQAVHFFVIGRLINNLFLVESQPYGAVFDLTLDGGFLFVPQEIILCLRQGSHRLGGGLLRFVHGLGFLFLLCVVVASRCQQQHP